MVVALRMRTSTLVVWWSLILYCSLVGMSDHEALEIEAEFDVTIVQDQDPSQDIIITQAHNPNLRSYLLSLPTDVQIEQIINQLEVYAMSFVQRDDCLDLFQALPENIL
ncbi:hypothetical protein JST56_00420 [Candidatus Dependentiae bacterium]|nr:hypothetical protein [Candidatus Dependentiae bacterium]